MLFPPRTIASLAESWPSVLGESGVPQALARLAAVVLRLAQRSLDGADQSFDRLVRSLGIFSAQRFRKLKKRLLAMFHHTQRFLLLLLTFAPLSQLSFAHLSCVLSLSLSLLLLLSLSLSILLLLQLSFSHL